MIEGRIKGMQPVGHVYELKPALTYILSWVKLYFIVGICQKQTLQTQSTLINAEVTEYNSA